MRKLFKEVRKKFKATTAIRLFLVTSSSDSETEITKSDNVIGNRDVGISNGARLRVQIHPSNPEIYTVFVSMPGGINKSFQLDEVAIAIYS